MRGDSEYHSQHKHGIAEGGRAASGAHQMQRASPPAESKEIKHSSVSFRGHLVLTFVDGSILELQRGDYDMAKPPIVGEFWPRGGTVANESNSQPQKSAAADSGAGSSVVGNASDAAATPQPKHARNRRATSKKSKTRPVRS